jgi:hypothetical protein
VEEESGGAASRTRSGQAGGLSQLLYSSATRIGLRLAAGVFQYALAGEHVFRDLQDIYIGQESWRAANNPALPALMMWAP